jgi:ABC-type transport system involved in multi-copper enzyme maturation permease subunit
MIALVKAEFLKLRTTRAGYGLLATAAALCALFASLEAGRAGNGRSGVPPLRTVAGFTTVSTVTGFAMLLAAVLGVIVTSGEFRHATATLTYLATPARGRVLTAKVIVAGLVGAIFGLVAAVIAAGTGLAFAAGRGDHVPLSAGTLAGHAAGAVLGAALLGALGAGLGSLARSQLAVVIGVFAWGIVVESILGGVFTSVRPYLPYTAATTLGGTRLGNAAFGPAHGLAGPGPLPFAVTAALLAALALMISLAAARSTVRHDIT